MVDLNTSATTGDEAGDDIAAPGSRLLNYETWGYPDSPPAILLHGLGGDLRDWQAVANILAARYWVVAPDLRGHGRSVPSDDTSEAEAAGESDAYSLDSLSADVNGLMDSLEIELAAISGAGLGAAIALNLALRSPARVPALVLADLELHPGRFGEGLGVDLELVGRLGPAVTFNYIGQTHEIGGDRNIANCHGHSAHRLGARQHPRGRGN